MSFSREVGASWPAIRADQFLGNLDGRVEKAFDKLNSRLPSWSKEFTGLKGGKNYPYPNLEAACKLIKNVPNNLANLKHLPQNVHQISIVAGGLSNAATHQIPLSVQHLTSSFHSTIPETLHNICSVINFIA